MIIRLNGAQRRVEAETLAELIAELTRKDGLIADHVATAVNGVFAPASRRAATRLKENDAIEILSPRQGG